jgi:hypothetical protein
MISLISTRMRVLYGVIASVIVLSAVVTVPEYGFSPVEAIVIALCVLAACYEERWSLDDTARTVSFRLGLVFLAKTKKIPVDDIAEIRIETFEKGFRKTSWTRVSIAFDDGRIPLVVETMPTKKAAKLTAFAERIRGLLQA